jgi:riboflavin biosynthesis pyrimidine reductase
MTVAAAPPSGFEALIAAERPLGEARGGLTANLRERYGGDLWFPLHQDRPAVIANFVTSLDGVVSFQTPDAMGGGEISGFYEPDRFVMGVLRALADVVMVGAGTMRATPKHRWVPEHVSRAFASDFAQLRSRLGLQPQPLTAIVSASGDVDLAHPGVSDPQVPVLIITTDNGATRLADHSPHVEVFSFGSAPPSARDIIELLARRGAELVLTEGGPHLIGQLLSEGQLDELFLTIAPQIAGRAPDSPRLALVEDAAFTVETAPWFDLAELRRDGDHLFTRYRIRGAAQ